MAGSKILIKNSLLNPKVLLNKFQIDQSFDPCSTYVILISISQAYEKVEQEYKNVLSEAEIEKSGRFIHEHDRKSYVVRKFILRTLLAKYGSSTARNVRFYVSENKKPTIEGVEFNASHSGNFAAIALSPSTIGIDIERLDTDFNYKNLLSSCFNEQESAFISDGQALYNFYTLWTRKEALLKATGEGLTDELPLLNCLPEMISRKDVFFRLSTHEIPEGYILSLCRLATEAVDPIYLIF